MLKIDKNFTIEVGQFGLWETFEFPYLFGGKIVQVLSQSECRIIHPWDIKKTKTLICSRPTYITDTEMGDMILLELDSRNERLNKELDELKSKEDKIIKLYLNNNGINPAALKDIK